MPTPLTVADRLALTDLAARYALAIDTRDFDGLRAIFLDDATLDTGRAVRSGIDEIIDGMQALHRYEATAHVLGQQVVEPPTTDATAAGVTYCTAHHLAEHGNHRTDKVMHIRYHDTFAETDDGWRIASRRLEVMWTDEARVG